MQWISIRETIIIALSVGRDLSSVQCYPPQTTGAWFFYYVLVHVVFFKRAQLFQLPCRKKKKKFTLQVPIVKNSNFLLMISIHCHEIRLWELIKWSPERKCLDLLSNSLNSFFKEMCRDQFGEFVSGYWGLKD